jgi:hypothetical protein
MGAISSRAAVRRVLTPVAIIAATGLLLAACSSGKTSGSITTLGSNGNTSTSGSVNSGGTASTSAPTTSSTGTSTDAKLSALLESVQGVKGRTFNLTYTETSSSGSHTLTFEQSPPKYLFEIAGSLLIDTGTTTYACTNTSGKNYCYSLGAGATYIAALLKLITGETVASSLQTLKSQLSAKLAGVNASFSSATFAGQPAQCISGTQNGNSFKYCVTSSGVMAYAGGSSLKTYGSISLVSYSTSVSSSSFSLPSGATVITVPSTSSTY